MTIHAFNQDLWRNKARSFVTRSHRHLWGKNNEAPLAFLFQCGLKNEFAKKQLLGWNKFGQNRPAENWGLKTDDNTLFLEAGLVIPYIKNRQLISVFIHPLAENRQKETSRMLPGSDSPTMVWEKNTDRILIFQDVFTGLFYLQESSCDNTIMIHPDKEQPFSKPHQNLIEAASDVRIFILNENKLIETTHFELSAGSAETLFFDTPEEMIPAGKKSD